MTYKLGGVSMSRLATCHKDIREIVVRALELSTVDFTVVCGGRGKTEQEAAFDAGTSKAHYGQSPHNAEPLSLAADLVPYVHGALVWDEPELFEAIADAMHQAQDELFADGRIAHKLENGFEQWGWDAPHWQIIGWKQIRDGVIV